MRYRCLVLDHDDTIVNSTATIHFPAFMEFMKLKRPQISMTLEEYFALNFEPGVVPLFRDICGLSPEEMKEEENFWRAYVKNHIPKVYDGMRDILVRHKKEGGLICVVSHSYSEYIYRDYAANDLPVPDLVFGWELEPHLRKPDPYALYEIMRQMDLRQEELLVLDDLKPGFEMAAAAGVPFAASGWANDVPQIEEFMRGNSPFYFKTPAEFGAWLSEA